MTEQNVRIMINNTLFTLNLTLKSNLASPTGSTVQGDPASLHRKGFRTPGLEPGTFLL